MAETQAGQQAASYTADAEFSLLDQIVQDGRVGRDAEAQARGKDLVKRFVAEVLEGSMTVSRDTETMINARIAQIDQSAGVEATIASATVRGKGLSVLGFTNFQVDVHTRKAAYRRMAEHAAAGELTCDVEEFPLDDVAGAWESQAAGPHSKLAIIP